MHISRGFHGRHREAADSDRIPPGQYVTSGFPVLSAGPTPRVALDQWSFVIRGELDEPRSWSWDELRALPREDITVDIHCVTKWSKLDTDWTGVSIDTLLEGVDTAAEYALAFCDGGYTTNVPLEDLPGGRAWLAFGYDGEPSTPSTAARSGCWCRTCTSGRAPSGSRDPACWTTSRVSGRATATTTTAIPGVNNATPAIELAARHRRGTAGRDDRTASIMLRVPDWPGHRAGQHVDVRLTAEDGYRRSAATRWRPHPTTARRS